MTGLSTLLFGQTATRLQVASSLATGAVGMLAVAAITGLERPADWLLLIGAFDVFGGVVSNAARSTRATQAASGPAARRRFLLIHAAEVPLFWWLAAGGPVFWLLAAGITAKLSIHALGVEDRHG